MIQDPRSMQTSIQGNKIVLKELEMSVRRRSCYAFLSLEGREHPRLLLGGYGCWH